MSTTSDTMHHGGDGGASSARVVVLQDNHCIATWRGFVIIIWRRETTAQGVADLRQALQRLGPTSTGVGLLTIIEPNAPPPTSEVRDGLAAVLGEFGKLIKFSAVAFEGSGFRAAMVRGVVTGLTMLARMPYPHKVFAGVNEATQWLIPSLQRIGWRDSAFELTEAVAELRRRIAAA
jgi:hypothetical protein